MIALRVAGVVAGVLLALGTVLSAVRTVVLPRGTRSRLASSVFSLLHMAFTLRLGRAADYVRRDRVFASYGPIALLSLLQTWLLTVFVGFAVSHYCLSPERGVGDAFTVSGSSLLTLGVDVPHGGLATALTFVEASMGLLLVALLIGFLPTIYSAFTRREAMVIRLEVRAGNPPTGGQWLLRAHRIGRLSQLDEAWSQMEEWFNELAESHTSFPALVYFRSSQPELSWVTAAGAALDAAALLESSVDAPHSVEAQLCLRAGTLSLRTLCDYFRIPFPADPQPGDPVTVTRDEWAGVVDELAAAGMDLVADRDQAWRDFAGWRVNYDVTLVALAALAQAPYAPWSSDRSLAHLQGRRAVGASRR